MTDDLAPPQEIPFPLGPVFMVQSGNGVEVAVLGDDGSMAQGQRDGGDLDVDLRHRATGAAKFGEQAAELASGLFGV